MLFLDDRRTKNTTNVIRIKPPTPPTTPPMMAFVVELEEAAEGTLYEYGDPFARMLLDKA